MDLRWESGRSFRAHGWGEEGHKSHPWYKIVPVVCLEGEILGRAASRARRSSPQGLNIRTGSCHGGHRCLGTSPNQNLRGLKAPVGLRLRRNNASIFVSKDLLRLTRQLSLKQELTPRYSHAYNGSIDRTFLYHD